MIAVSRPVRIAALVVAALFLAAWLVDLAGLPGGIPRHLVVVSIDTLRGGHLSISGYGVPTSPRLDAIAARGTTFLRAYSPSGWTVPAHMSLFTGLLPPAHGLVDFPDAGRLGPNYVTLAETLRASGFRTAAFTGGGFLSPQHGFEDGFERFVSRGRHFETKTGDVKDWISSLGEEDRFFVFLHGFDVHRPYRPPEAYARRFAERAVPGAGGGPLVADRLFPLLEDLAVVAKRAKDPAAAFRTRPPDEDLALIESQYDAEIARADDVLGDLLDWMDERGLLSETLLVVVSDHGEEFFEHGGLDHVHTLYDELLHVAWFMAGPNVPRGRSVVSPVGLVDVMPTVCELLDVPLRAPVQGGSRVGLAEASEDEEKGRGRGDALFAFAGYSGYPYRLDSVRVGGYKLVRWRLSGMRDAALGPDREHFTLQFRDEREDFVELFHVAEDPGETRDLSRERADVVAALSDMIDEEVAASAAFAAEPGERPRITREYLEELRSLGYLR